MSRSKPSAAAAESAAAARRAAGDPRRPGRGAANRPALVDPTARPPRRFRLGRRAVDALGAGWQGALETPALWLLLFLLLGTWALLPSGLLFAPRVAAGSIAGRDYVAPRDLLLPDEATTREKQERARQDVLPVYDLDLGLARQRARQMGALFARGRRLLERAGEGEEGRRRVVAELLARHPEAEGAEGLTVSEEQLDLLARRGFSPSLEERLAGVLARALRRGVVGNKRLLVENRIHGVLLRNLESGREERHFDLFDHLGYPDELRGFLEEEARDWRDLPAGEQRLLVGLVLDNLQPNLDLNRSETLARRQAAAAAVAPVFTQVRKGQVIVRTGDQVDAAQARVIAHLVGERRSGERLPPLFGTLLLLALAAGAVWLGLRHERVLHHGRRRLFGEALLLLLLALLGAKLAFLVSGGLARSFEAPPLDSFRSYAYATPFAALGLVAALLFGRHAALVLALLFAVLASRLAESEPQWVVLYAVGGALAAVYAAERHQFKHRAVLVRVGLLVGTANVLMVLIFLALGGGTRAGLLQAGFDLLMAFGGGLFVAAIASFALPALEGALDIATDIKLVELSNTNLPLLRRLAFEAPGTFQHSLMVANLAKEGCESIGADPVLAYTGALYHDVGKVFRPEYFVENQRPGHNRHDKLAPSMSALVLINHVKEGVELARQARLPRPVIDAIEQHHGTRLIKYFYNRALEQSGAGNREVDEVREAHYRYPGPKPQGKAMGVLMLADAVEAASRTLVEPTTGKIRALIRGIHDDCLRDGQLDETDLTLSDLSRVADAFERVLANIFHQRVDYPGFDWNARRPKRGAGAARAS